MRKMQTAGSLLIILFTLLPLSAGELVKRRVLLLDFSNVSKNANYEYLKESLADNLKTELIKTQKFDVIDQRAFESLFPGVLTNSKLTVESATQLALDANCEAVVFGKFVVAGKNIRINAQAVDALTGKPVAAEKADGSVTSEIFQTIDAVVNPLTAGMVANLGAIDRDKTSRKQDVEEKIASIDNKQESAASSSNISAGRFTLHTLGLYSLPMPKMDTYINGGYGGKIDASYKLHKFIYPYIQGSVFFASGKGSVTSMMFYATEAGLTYPLQLGKILTLSPFFAAGIHGGNLIKTQTNSFLLASFGGGVHADFQVTKLLSITVALAFTYIPDMDLPMSFTTLSIGTGFRF